MKQKTILTACLLSGLSIPAFAEIERQHGAHVHGTGTLNIAVEGNELEIEFKAPSFDIVGFGHEAKSDEDKKKMQTALANLKAVDKMFTLPAAAQCKLDEAHVARETTGEKHEEHDHDDHKKHADKHDHDDHKKHADKHDHDDHKKHTDKHDHDDHKKAGKHSEFHAHYEYKCADVTKVDGLKTGYFDLFERAAKLKVQWVLGKGQGKGHMTKTSNAIKF